MGRPPKRQDSHSIPALGRQHCQDTAELGELWRIQGRLSLALKVDSVSRLKLTMGKLMGRSWSTCEGHWHRPPLYSPVPTWAAQFDKPALPLLYAIQLWPEFFYWVVHLFSY